ncbi:MAG: hypothetical protein ACI38Z_05105 [Parafannyhessea sp.]|uniref:hypothetical protein n=1 Tax=Parafannyhessea sp. TaxID=2847324 RepID=UPI003EFED54C
MRLSDVPGSRAIETLARLARPVAAMVTDETVRKAVLAAKDDKEKAAAAAIPLVMERHGQDVTECLAAIAGETREGYEASHNLAQVLGDLYELLTDEEAISFLGSMRPTAGNASS